MINLIKTIRSFRYAGRGVVALFRAENNAKVHLLAGLVVVVAGFWLRVSPLEWAMLVTQIGLVWAAEAVNTALEKLADVVSPDHHPQIGAAKDIAAGAVLILAIMSVIVAVLILGPKLFAVCSPILNYVERSPR
jgi:diacylglycerol kinase